MKKINVLLYILFFLGTTVTKAQSIATFAGNGIASFSGDGGQATVAELGWPNGVATDASGNIYIEDDLDSHIREVNSSGIISTVVGNGVAGFSGDGGPATAAEINNPEYIIVDASGNLYIADFGNNCIREVNTSGVINTIAGNGVGSYYGDGGLATAAELNGPDGIAIDGSGNIYIGEYYGNRVRIINSSGIINTFAGNGIASYYGDGGPATAAEFDNVGGITLDVSGNLYLADQSNNDKDGNLAGEKKVVKTQ